MRETQAIEQMWRHIYTTGVGDPLMGLNLISYFFILKGLEERSFRLGAQDTLFASVEAEACHWSMIKQMAEVEPQECCQHLRTNVVRWLRTLDPESCLADAEQAFIQVQPRVVYPLMEAIDALCAECFSMQDAFEAVLAWAEREGAFQPRAGQIMTPMHIAYLMADLVRPTEHERVIDASCGVGNLLVAAWQHMQRHRASSSWLLENGQALCPPMASQVSHPALWGYDFNPMMLPPCYAHLLLSGIDVPHVCCSDALGSVFNDRLARRELGDIDVVLGNPPFGAYTDISDLGDTFRDVGTLDADILFIELALQLLREGGRAAILVPEGVVRNASRAAVAIRKKLVQEHRLLAAVSLPPGIFLPQANVKTTLLLFHKGGYTGDDVLFYRVSADGYSFDARRRATPGQNDLWDLRAQVAATMGQTPSVQALSDARWWSTYASDKHAPGTRYIASSTEDVAYNPATGERLSCPFRHITGFAVTPATEKRSWFIPIEEIEANGHFSLCVHAYREQQVQPQTSRRRRDRQ